MRLVKLVGGNDEMRTTIALAAFLVAGAGAVGVSALDLKGSDTLEGVTSALLTDAALDCGGTTNTPAGTLVYIGTGSGNGESAILSGAQQVAPMSRALAAAATCAAADGGFVPTAEGIVFALDGLSIVASNSTGSSEACNGGFDAGCAPQIAKGLAFGGVVINVPGYVCPTAIRAHRTRRPTAPASTVNISCSTRKTCSVSCTSAWITTSRTPTSATAVTAKLGCPTTCGTRASCAPCSSKPGATSSATPRTARDVRGSGTHSAATTSPERPIRSSP